MNKKILVAVDGSSYSTKALHYVGKLFREQAEVTFHLFSIVSSGGTGSAAREWLNEEELQNVISPAVRNRLQTQKKYLKDAVYQLGRFGIGEERITSEVRLSHLGIAKDIIQEARKGLYDALLIGRRGIGKLEELIMGSVSQSIFEECHDVPLWIVDGEVNSCKFLVPVDGSVHSLKALDHLLFIISGNPCAEITLFYSTALLGERPEINPQEFYDLWGREWCDEHLSRPDSLFHGPRQLLIDGGFPEERISWLETFKGFDPSRQILRQALIDDFGTIVMGRRGSDATKGLFRGVSDRVMLMAEQVAIWIVG